MGTYLGIDAAKRVLAGNIVRGRAEPIRAVIWFSDLVGFTRISDTASPGTVLELLNDYAEAQVEEIEARGGHVLKFIGDGILAIFPQDDMAQACSCALDAAANLTNRIATLNTRRAAHGMPVTSTHIALHVGELLYGNLGSPAGSISPFLAPPSTRPPASSRFGLPRAGRHRVDSLRRGFGRGATAPGQRRSLCNEGHRPATRVVHAGSRVRACRLARCSSFTARPRTGVVERFGRTVTGDGLCRPMRPSAESFAGVLSEQVAARKKP